MILRLLALLLLAASCQAGAAQTSKKPPPARRPPPQRQPPPQRSHSSPPPRRSPPNRLPPQRSSPAPSPRLRPRPPSPFPPSPRSPRPVAPPAPPPPTVLQLLNQYSDVSLARTLFTLPGTQADFWVRSPSEVFTLFVPNDKAVALYLEVLGLEPGQLLDTFRSGQLALLTKYHFLSGAALTTRDLRSSRKEPTALPGFNVSVTKSWPEVFVTSAASRAKMVRPNLAAGKAVVHIVDRVLVPFDLYHPPVVADYSTLGEALQFERLNNLNSVVANAGLSSLLPQSDFVATVFAPTDKAWQSFAAALGGPMLAGTINGSAMMSLLSQKARNQTLSAFIDAMMVSDHLHIGAPLSAADLSSLPTLPVGGDPASYDTPGSAKILVRTVNGTLQLSGVTSANVVKANIYIGRTRTLVVHVVDGVLLSYQTAQLLGILSSSSPSPLTGAPPPARFRTLQEALASTPETSALVAALSAAGLTDAISDPNTVLTIFAPSNRALMGIAVSLNVNSLNGLPSSLAAMAFGDHIHFGKALLSSNLPRGNTSLPVGFNALTYGSDPLANLLVTVNQTGVFLSSFGGVAKVIKADIVAGRSVVHIIDGFLMTTKTAIALGLYQHPHPVASPSGSQLSLPPPLMPPPPTPPPPTPRALQPSAEPLSQPVPASMPQPSPPSQPPPSLPPPPPPPSPPPPSPSLDVIRVNRNFSSLPEALAAQNFSMLLSMYKAARSSPVGDILTSLLAEPFTLLAPTDAAINARLAAMNTNLDRLSANPISIAGFILPHLWFGQAAPLTSLTDGFTFTTGYAFLPASPRKVTVQRTGDVLYLATSGGGVRVAASELNVVYPDGNIIACIHVIDRAIP